jgi:hypothetical protein
MLIMTIGRAKMKRSAALDAPTTWLAGSRMACSWVLRVSMRVGRALPTSEAPVRDQPPVLVRLSDLSGLEAGGYKSHSHNGANLPDRRL